MILSRVDGLGWKETKHIHKHLNPRTVFCCACALSTPQKKCFAFCRRSSPPLSSLSVSGVALMYPHTRFRLFLVQTPPDCRWIVYLNVCLHECVLFCTHNFVTVTCCLPGIFLHSRTTLLPNPSRPENGFVSLIITLIEISIKSGFQTRRRVLRRDAEPLMQNRV